MPLSSRHQFDVKSGRVVFTNIASTDSGQYRCTATNAQGESASGLVFISVAGKRNGAEIRDSDSFIRDSDPFIH